MKKDSSLLPDGCGVVNPQHGKPSRPSQDEKKAKKTPVADPKNEIPYDDNQGAHIIGAGRS